MMSEVAQLELVLCNEKAFLLYFVYFFLQSTLIIAQIKIEGRVDPIQDTIYLNELDSCRLLFKELLTDGFYSFSFTNKLSDSLYEYIVCGGNQRFIIFGFSKV